MGRAKRGQEKPGQGVLQRGPLTFQWSGVMTRADVAITGTYRGAVGWGKDQGGR
jgi:hypothetical protein